ncbi:hypothetical protein [Methanobrevibacter arboriphilus]|uniref:hypothetical protein n=1 Tax=Methanobrevibacter arboriphilus TaxID=39441 RepID=UPI0006D0B5FB|nr:hypothetical protein [Methanobrevibacter arboriphilus]
MVNLKRHPDYKSIRHNPIMNSLQINTNGGDSKPYMIIIKDFTIDDWDDLKETEYSKKHLEENIFKNPEYHLLGHNGSSVDNNSSNLDFGKYETWVKVVS